MFSHIVSKFLPYLWFVLLLVHVLRLMEVLDVVLLLVFAPQSAVAHSTVQRHLGAVVLN